MIFILHAYCVYCYQTADPQMTVESWGERQKGHGGAASDALLCRDVRILTTLWSAF